MLNEGGAATRSDTLVVDGTSVGSGPTSMAIRNAGGAGAFTPGNGILVVEALDKPRSAAGVFTLGGGSVSAGAFEYTLFHGGVGADAANGNWYLRSTVDICTVRPALCQPPIPPTIPPTYPTNGAAYPTNGGAYATIADVPELPPRNLALCGDPGDGAALRPQSARHAA